MLLFYWQTIRNALQMVFSLGSCFGIGKGSILQTPMAGKQCRLALCVFYQLDVLWSVQKNVQHSQFSSSVLLCFHLIRCLKLFSIVGFSAFICWVTFAILIHLDGRTSCKSFSMTLNIIIRKLNHKSLRGHKIRKKLVEDIIMSVTWQL